MKLHTLLRAIGGAVLLVLLVAVAVLLYVMFGDLSVYKDRIAAAASDATGFEVAIDGPMDLRIRKKVDVTFRQTTITNPAWPDDTLATVDSLHVLIDTWSILRGPLEIDELTIDGGLIGLREYGGGEANWIVAPSETPQQTEDPSPEPLLHSTDLAGLQVAYQAEGDAPQGGTIQELELSRNADRSFAFKLLGAYTQEPEDFTFATSGQLTRHDGGIGISNLELNVLGGEITGSLTMDQNGDRPSMEANLNATRLDLRTAGTSDASSEGDDDKPASDSGEQVFSDSPLSLEWLNTMNLQASATIDEIVLNEDVLNDTTIDVTLSDGLLNVSQLEFSNGDGKVSGTLGLGPDNDRYIMRLKATVTDYRVGALLAEDQDAATLPPLSAELELTGQGNSLHQIMSTSSGRLSGRQESGQIDLQAVSVLFSDLVVSILRTLNPLAEAQAFTNLECGIYEIDIVDGIANIEEFAAQSDRLTILSSGSINLNTEEIDVTLSTKSREGLGVSVGGIANSFLKLGGTLKEPSVGVDAAGSVTTTGAAVATGGLSVLAKGLWDRLSASVDVCASEPVPAD